MSLHTHFSQKSTIRLSVQIFYLEFILFMAGMIWHHTDHASTSFFTYWTFIALTECLALLAVLNIFFLCSYSKRQLCEIAALLVLLLISHYCSHRDDGFLLCSIALVLSAHRVQPASIFRNIFKAYLAVCGIVFLLYALHILNKWELTPPRYRYNLGFSHPNMLGLVVVCIVFVWLIIRYGHLKWYDYAGWCACIAFVWLVPNSRTAALAIALLIIFTLLSKTLNIFRFKIVRVICYLSFPALAVFSYTLSYFYRGDSRLYLVFDALFSKRFSSGQVFLQQYPITLFGQKLTRISQMTARNTGQQPAILDNGYLRLLLQLGLVTTLIFLALLIYIMYRSLQEKHYAVTIGLLVISFYTVSEYFLASLFCNAFLLFFMYYRYGTAGSDGEIQRYPLPSEELSSDTPFCYACPQPDNHSYLHFLKKHRLCILLFTVVAIAIFGGNSLKQQIDATKAYHAAYPDGTQEIVLTLSADELPAVEQYLQAKETADTTGQDTDTANAQALYDTLSDNARNYIKKYMKYEMTDPSQPVVYREKVPSVWVSKRKAALIGIKGGILGGALAFYILFLLYVCKKIPEKKDQK